MEYKLLQKSHTHFVVTKNGEVIWDSLFSQNYKASYGFSATTADGDKYELQLKGMFFWRTLSLLKNDVFISQFKPSSCLLPNNIYLDGRKFIYEKHGYICSLDAGHLDKTETDVVYFWETDREDLEWIIITLAMLSKQCCYKTFSSSYFLD